MRIRCSADTPSGVPKGFHLIEGTSGNDVIRGSDRRKDFIRGQRGDDKLIGLGKRDILCGGLGDDTMIGGKGRDDLYGEEGDDRLNGRQGADFLDGGAGLDQVFGFKLQARRRAR